MTLTAAEVAEIMRLVEQSGFDELTLEIDGTKISLQRGASASPKAAVAAAVYRAPKPGAPPFVEVGAPVEADTIVAIIEVMKLMNTVRAGVRGTVAEILKADGALAEYGETLMRVRKSG
jgi:acetyl-CoA carboxylase biotin carboxyl carrier protein